MYTPRYREKYEQEVIPALKEQFGFKSIMRVPKIKKICLNQGLGKFGIADKKLIDLGVQEMTLIAGQKAVSTKSK
ncbi:MAG: 50S ribosomal protein L5, partial [Bacteroidales bacterium]|nr:50S ribosomal protein L5 [Bacteroidales bacterium]